MATTMRAGEACIVPQGVIHPNGYLTTKPWGTQEFAILDPAGVCMTFYEPVAQRPAIHP